MEQVRTEQRFLRFFEEHTSVPAVGQMGSLAITKTVLPGAKVSPSVRARDSRPIKSFTFTSAPTWLQITLASGAAVSHSLSDPHSSDSKWLKPIWRNSETLISFETASRISAYIPRSPVW